MRIIKLSNKDKSFPDRKRVDSYFLKKLPNRNPPGKFRLTQGRVAKDSIEIGEKLIFSYKTEIIYIGLSASGRIDNSDEDMDMYPFYFIIDIDSLVPAKGNLSDIESMFLKAGIKKNLVSTRGWPRIQDSPVTKSVWNNIKA